MGFTPDMERCSSDTEALATTPGPLGNLSFTAAAPFSLEGVTLSGAFLDSYGLWRCAPRGARGTAGRASMRMDRSYTLRSSIPPSTSGAVPAS